jgi:hypothetical protein
MSSHPALGLYLMAISEMSPYFFLTKEMIQISYVMQTNPDLSQINNIWPV